MENIFRKVGHHFDLNLRIELGLPPRKLDPKIISNLESKFPRPTLVYLPDTKTLFNFKLRLMRILRPLTLDYMDESGLSMFNILSEDWSYEIISEEGSVHIEPMNNPWCTELKVSIR